MLVAKLKYFIVIVVTKKFWFQKVQIWKKIGLYYARSAMMWI